MAKLKKDKKNPKPVDAAKQLAENNLELQSLVAELTGALEASGGYYVSSHDGPVKLSDMHSVHLWNAYVKRYKSWLDSLMAISDVAVRMTAKMAGPTDVVLLSLEKALKDRVAQEVSADVDKARKQLKKKKKGK